MSKVNGIIWKILGISIIVLFAVIGVVFGYGRHIERVETLQKTAIKADKNERAVIGLQKDIEYIKKAVDRIERKMDE